MLAEHPPDAQSPTQYPVRPTDTAACLPLRCFANTINQFKGKVGMIFITHAMPKSLLVDEIVRIGKGSLSAVGGQEDVRTTDEQRMRNEKT